MVIRLCVLLGSLSLSAGPALANDSCNAANFRSLPQVQRIVDSLRFDKPGQIRVYAIDGGEYTGGQAQWMKGQLRDVDAACAKGDSVTAALHLQAVLDALRHPSVS